MKINKYYFYSFIFLLLCFCNSCTSDELRIKNINYDEGIYYLETSDDYIDLSKYIICDGEYIINYKDNNYTNKSCNFKLDNKDNYFLVSYNGIVKQINIYKVSYYNLYIFDDDLNIIDKIVVKENTYINSSIINVNKYQKEGYHFSGKFYYSSDLSFNKVGLFDEVIIESDLSVKLVYELDEYRLCVNVNNDKYFIDVLFGDKIILNTPLLNGYKFKGWYINDILITDDFIYHPSYGDNIYALFEANTYTITYKYFNNECVQEVIYNEEFTLLTPSFDGYEFLYWSYEGECFSDGIWTYLENITLEVVVNKIGILLNIETFGGICDNTSSVDENNNLVLPTPYLEDYKFIGWYYDKFLSIEVGSINKDEYNNELLYAKYEYDSNDLIFDFVVTRYNKHTSNYDEVVIFDSSMSGFTSLYWLKIAVKESSDGYYISGIGKSGDKLSSLGDYDFVILAYSSYPYYNDLLSGEYSVYDKVVFLKDPNSSLVGDEINMVSILKPDEFDDQINANRYLDELYGSINDVCDSINLVTNYNQYKITWESSNRDCLDSLGNYCKPYVTRNVTLNAFINDTLVYSFTVRVIGEKEESDAIATGYIYTPYNTITQNAMNGLDIIYCAFLEIDSLGNFTNETRMTSNIKSYILPLAKVSNTKVVISVNQDSSGCFSNVSADEVLRKKLANNILNFIIKLGLDGVDIDWETPSSTEASNFTLLMKDIYDVVKGYNSNFYITAAIGGGKWAPPKYDLLNSCKYLDYINMMTYSMATGNGYYQNSLYKSSKGATLVSCSIEESIEIYHSYNIPNSKILVGVPFYLTVQTNSEGPGSKKGDGKSIWYDKLFSTYMLSDTMKEYFDYECGVPYRYDDVNKIFISFDNEESIKIKCDYINTLGLAGIMYWQYGQDVDDYLSNAIFKYINY